MIYILFSILSIVTLLLVFKLLPKYNIAVFPVIVINYLVASLGGWIYSYLLHKQLPALPFGGWISAIVIGILFVLLFFVVAQSSQKAGIGVTAVASKMSFIIPAGFSLLFLSELASVVKLVGLGLGAISVFLVAYKKDNKVKGVWYLPLLLFVGDGIVNVIVKWSQQYYLNGIQADVFGAVLFSSSMIAIFVSVLVKNDFADYKVKKVWIAGIVLGIANYASLFFFIGALNFSDFDSSVVFSINNVGIVLFSTIIGYGVFKESINRRQLFGWGLAILSMLILAMV